MFEAIGKTQEALKRKERPRRAVRREAVKCLNSALSLSAGWSLCLLGGDSSPVAAHFFPEATGAPELYFAPLFCVWRIWYSRWDLQLSVSGPQLLGSLWLPEKSGYIQVRDTHTYVSCPYLSLEF